MDFSRISEDEKINGIKITNVPKYIRDKAYLTDFSETLAQLAEMIIQLGVNLSLDPDDALEWARKLQESVSQAEFDSWVATLLDGGPSLFFETKAALVAKHPNGAAGVALVRETDPAKIYVWNGSAWEDFGDYQGIELKDGTVTTSKLVKGAVTADNTNFAEMVKINILTGYTITNGYLGTDGVTFVGSSSYRSPTELIPVLPNTTYEHNFYNLNIYGQDGKIISAVGSATINGTSTYTTNSSTYFVSPVISNATVPVGDEYFYDITNNSVIIPNLTLIHERNKEIEFVDVNILDEFDYVAGYYIPNGLNPDNKYYTTTEPIPVTPGATYEHNFYNINLHNSNGTMRSAVGSAVINGKGSYTIPNDTNYITPTVRLSDVPMGEAYLYSTADKHFKVNGLIVTEGNFLKTPNDTKYVSTTGNDNNRGTISSPFKTISKAIESGAETINIERGKYVEQFSANADKLILNAYGDSEADVIVSGADTLTNWTAYNAIYKKTYSQNNKYFNAVFITKTQQPIITGARSDTYGATIWEGNNGVDDYKMKPVLTLAECEAEVGTFYYDGTDVYINPQNINSEFNAVRLDGNSIVANELKMNDIKFDFFTNEVMKLDNVKNLETNNVEFNHSVRADGASIDRTNGTFNNSKAFKNRNDGFNLHYKGATVFNNCYGINNYDDGISHHESCEGIINGGVWSGNGKGGISPAYGAKVNWYNCILENNAYGIFGESYDGVENISSGNLYKGNTVDIRATNGKILSFNDKFLDGEPKLEGTQRITVY